MRKLLAMFALAMVVILGLAPAFASAATQDLGGFDIRKFTADIDIREDSTVHVVETIDIRFLESRHGIFRNIPVDYTNDKGNNVSIRLDVTDVEADGSDVPYEISRDGDDMVLKIGDADVLVKGDVKYTIAYDATRILLNGDGTDELYWNVTGTEWPVVPRLVETFVRLPLGVAAADVEKSCYTGGYGSTAKACEMKLLSTDGRVVVATTANDFLTVAVRFPEGHIIRPTFWTKLWWFISDNKILGLPILLFVLLFAYWWREGRDPKPRAIVTEFDAPDGLSPAELGVLEDGKVHDRELSATIVDLAVRGYLKIVEKEEEGFFGASRSFTLERTGKSITDLKAHEQLLFEAVMGDAERRELSELSGRAKEVKQKRDEAEKVLYDLMAEKKYFVRNPETVRKIFIGVGFTLGFAAIWIVAGISVAWMFSLLLCAVMIAGFGFVMPKRTEQGTRAYEHVLGFREYLSRAEKYRLQWQEKEGVFEKFLPYAMVFMVVDKWTGALASVINQPSWYQSSRPGVWDAYIFSNVMTDLNRSLNSAVMVAPKSASSGGSGIGGGFSGGGFGGGGGGSW